MRTISDMGPHPPRPPLQMWWDAEAASAGGPTCKSTPTFEPPAVPDVDDGSLVYRDTLDLPLVRMHLQEFAENSADPQHFQPLHDSAYIPGTLIPIPFLRVIHATTWGAGGAVAEAAAAALGSGIPATTAGPGAGASGAAPGTFSPTTIVDRVEEDGSRTVGFQGRHLAVFCDKVAIEFRGKRVEKSDTVAQITCVCCPCSA